MKTTKIITHPGQRHRDDFLAVCWLLGNGAQNHEVFCKEPTEEELNDSEIYVLDIGGRYEPARRNFDHHQFPAAHPPTCALQLLLEFDLGKDEAHTAFPWLRVTSMIDSKGLGATAKHYGSTVDLCAKFGSPVERLLLEQFAKVTHLRSEDPLFQIMQALGCSMRERASLLQECVKRVVVRPALHNEGQSLSVESVRIMIADPASVTSMPALQYLPEVMEIKRRTLQATGFDPEVSISPSVDGRGPGWTLYRYDDNPRIDFKRIEGDPRVTFAHANGFIAKVHPDATLEDLLFLIGLAVVEGKEATP